MKKNERKWKYVWEDGEHEKENVFESPLDSKRRGRPVHFEFEIKFPGENNQKMPINEIEFHQTEKELIANISVPGFDKDEIELSLSPNEIYLKAKKRKSSRKNSEGMSFSMMQSSLIQKSFKLPVEIDPQKSLAKLENGVLTITMQKKKKGRFNIFGH